MKSQPHTPVQVLARDVVYDLVPLGQRRDWHARLAQAMERYSPSAGQEDDGGGAPQKGESHLPPTTIAYHWSQACRGVEAAQVGRVGGWSAPCIAPPVCPACLGPSSRCACRLKNKSIPPAPCPCPHTYSGGGPSRPSSGGSAARRQPATRQPMRRRCCCWIGRRSWLACWPCTSGRARRPPLVSARPGSCSAVD